MPRAVSCKTRAFQLQKPTSKGNRGIYKNGSFGTERFPPRWLKALLESGRGKGGGTKRVTKERKVCGVWDDRTCRDPPAPPQMSPGTRTLGAQPVPLDIRKLSDAQIAWCHTRLSDSVGLGCGQEIACLTSSHGLPLLSLPATAL